MNTRAKLCRSLLRALKGDPFKLARQPRRRIEFKSSATGPDWLTLRNACVCAAPKFRVAGELDLAPDLLVVDYGLGTIGLVHVILPSGGEPLAEQAKRHVDQATYLRHLLATRGVTAGTGAFPLDYTVECVLVLQHELAHETTGVVREIAANTRFLHATGLNLLYFRPPCEIQPADLRRAFAWLLPSARERLAGCGSPVARLRSLDLFDYRLPGLLPWTLDGNRVHLLHGANGAGKSSIAEALELAVTGSVERIQSNAGADYSAIIRNSESTGSATVRLSLSDGRTNAYTVVATGVSEPALQRDLPVTAFRLDQTVMDQLIRGDSRQRARIFTRSFFPGEAYRNLELAQEEFNNAYKELPSELRQEIGGAKPDPNEWAAAAVPRLEWVDGPSAPVGRIDDCLPLKREHLEALGRIDPEVTASLDSMAVQPDITAFEAKLEQLDEALGRVRSNARRYREAVVQCSKALERLENWTPEPGEVRLEYTDLLGRWTERLALSDVLTKHLEISRSLLEARAGGWKPGFSDPAGLLAASEDALRSHIDRLGGAAMKCAEERDDFFQQLQSSSPAAAGAAGKRAAATLSAGEIADLNLASAWLARQEATPPAGLLGDTLEKAISENIPAVFGTITIGGQGWTRRPLEFLKPLQPALDALLAFEQAAGAPPDPSAPASPPPPTYLGPMLRLHSYREALKKARLVAAAYQGVEATLMKRLQEHKLNEALNEVIALFTPARWAYEGLFMSPNLRDGKVAVELVTSKTHSAAEMRLNTAELNLVVLSLYLLCAPTIDNPLGTVILDDPLQNMDELTSATVARGVSKVAALLPEGWQLLLMFHGEEDLETFRREVPGSVYYLPWLAPIGAAVRNNGAGVRAAARAGRVAAETQRLDEVFRLDLRRLKAPSSRLPAARRP